MENTLISEISGISTSSAAHRTTSFTLMLCGFEPEALICCHEAEIMYYMSKKSDLRQLSLIKLLEFEHRLMHSGHTWRRFLRKSKPSESRDHASTILSELPHEVLLQYGCIKLKSCPIIHLLEVVKKFLLSAIPGFHEMF